jgi:uncharacterized protein (TIGR03067 family)
MLDRFLATLPFLVALPASVSWGGGGEQQGAKVEAINKELKRLQGTWEINFKLVNGRTVQFPDRAGRGKYRMTISADSSVVVDGMPKDAPKLKYRLDPLERPKRVDLIFPPPKSGKQVVTEGIYEFDGDELQMCFATVGHPRPTDFTCNEGSGRFLEVYRRVKDKK